MLIMYGFLGNFYMFLGKGEHLSFKKHSLMKYLTVFFPASILF